MHGLGKRVQDTISITQLLNEVNLISPHTAYLIYPAAAHLRRLLPAN